MKTRGKRSRVAEPESSVCLARSPPDKRNLDHHHARIWKGVVQISDEVQCATFGCDSTWISLVVFREYVVACNDGYVRIALVDAQGAQVDDGLFRTGEVSIHAQENDLGWVFRFGSTGIEVRNIGKHRQSTDTLGDGIGRRVGGDRQERMRMRAGIGAQHPIGWRAVDLFTLFPDSSELQNSRHV